MNDKTLTALTALAQKLGTTAEYLWGVLLKQAPITGTINLIIMVVSVVVGVWWFRFVQRKTTVPPSTAENACSSAEWENEGAGIAWISVFIAGLLMALVVVLGLPSVVAAFLNPEYWVLQQILR